MIQQIVHEAGKECLDVKMYESLARNEDGLVSHTRIYRNDTGRMAHKVLFCRETAPVECSRQRDGVPPS